MDASATLRSWVEQYSERMYSWAYQRTSDTALAEDLVQDTFLEAVRSFEQFEGKSQPKTWLFAILNHKIIDYHRKQFRNPVQSQSSLQHPGKSKGDDFLNSFFGSEANWLPGKNPQTWNTDEEDVLNDPEFQKALQRCMAALPGHWFSAVQLKYLEEKGGKHICQVLGISPSNFWQILHRARLKLRECLEHSWFKKR